MTIRAPQGIPHRNIISVLGVTAFVLFALRCGNTIHIKQDAGSDIPDDRTHHQWSDTAETAPDVGDGNQNSTVTLTEHFNWSAPAEKEIQKKLKLWATNYYVPEFRLKTDPQAYIRGLDEQSLFGDEGLTNEQWCDLALQGSARIKTTQGLSRTVSFAGRSGKNRMSCTTTIASAEIADKISGNRFEIVSASFGRGARVQEVIPFRTIAVDPDFIPHGSVIYIPAAKGQSFLLNETRFKHDGYFFSGDSGSAIIDNHIDLFTGTESFRGTGQQSLLGFVTSSDMTLFDAFVINNPKINSRLRSLHGYIGE